MNADRVEEHTVLNIDSQAEEKERPKHGHWYYMLGVTWKAAAGAVLIWLIARFMIKELARANHRVGALYLGLSVVYVVVLIAVYIGLMSTALDDCQNMYELTVGNRMGTSPVPSTAVTKEEEPPVEDQIL